MMKVDAPVAETLIDANDEDGITITTATRSEEELRASFGLEAPPLSAEAQAAADEAAKLARAAIIDPELDAELDKVEPPVKDETPEQRTERRSRSQKKILKEIALRKQATERADRAEAELATLRTKVTPPPAGDKTKADAPNAAEKPATEKFTFPTFAEYQETHPEAEWDDWSDARSDARDEWKDKGRAAAAAATKEDLAIQRAVTVAEEATATFKESHADFDEVTNMPTPTLADGKTPTEPVTYLQKLILREGERVPHILYYLGQHRDEALKLMQSETLGEMLEGFGAVKAHVAIMLKGGETTPVVKEPAKQVITKPVPKAPAPLTEVKGGQEHARTAAQIAEDDEDADAYIAQRNAEMAGSR